MKKTLIILFVFQAFFIQAIHAQTANPDFMRSTGKIYVVVAVIIAMFIGIVAFLAYMDRKLTFLENQTQD